MEYFSKKYRHLKSKILHKFHRLLFFFYFFILFDILFSISSIYTFQQILEIFIFFISWTRDFIKEFWKIMEYFSKKYTHLKSIILHKVHRLLFVFFFQHFGHLFFLFHLSKLVKKFETFLWCFIERITYFMREF